MHPGVARFVRLLAGLLSVVLLVALAAAGWFYWQMRGSLAQLDGTRAVAGLTAPVQITRDALGVPTVQGANRLDVARALGFLHAQDRFFQMDLLRRRSAGELAALFGKAAVPLDQLARPHRFRQLAQQVLAAADPAHRAVIEAYAAGVNSGLAALHEKPFEYFLFREDPQPWQPEDSVLVVYAMVLDLQDELNTRELSLMTLRDQFGSDAVSFFAPLFSPEDAALDGTTAALPPIPGPNAVNLREGAAEPGVALSSTRVWPRTEALWADGDFLPGSNSIAVTGAHTATGAALLGNDPHLNLGVPNIWYRVVMQWPVNASAGARHRLVGVTIPGVPFLVLGSNGHVAWGMTTSFADTNDLIPLDLNPTARDLYRVPGAEELAQIEKHTDEIAVRGGQPASVESQWAVWGPIVGEDQRGRPLAHRWVAHDPTATNLKFFNLENAATVADAVAVAHESGIPAHNFLVADAAGSIGWTIVGRVPRRVGFSGRLPVSWTFGDRRWNGLLPPDEVPTVILTPGETSARLSGGATLEPRAQAGRLWTANNRLVGGDALARLGDGGYMAPMRAQQVRDDLLAIKRATPADFLALALDDRAVFLERWQKLLLSVLTPEAVQQKKSRAELRRLVEQWEGRAATDSVSYRLVRAFRTTTADMVFEPIFARCVAQTPQFNWRNFHYEPALWTLLHEKPLHLLAPEHDSWDTLMLAAADRVVDEIEKTGTPLEKATWGRRNTARIRHPLSRVLPGWIGRWLDLPADPLPGDTHMPRVQNPSFGASMRLAVSPGREEEGLFEMPGGQSGHPLSPFYRAGHAAWVHGERTPLLPGETRHTLTLTP
ncbi:penicillin acylase family protein [Opitutus terrae]|uniref:Penicillin amidase n=1 Tax=Opitutus terrae (strain DSM 11246 / JCM 15787 / PB90-1) TaxID=452637 RepID=B1ZVM2_OPITP|nr:penicillin acylase family protein [Opitutus terrae]ACB74119.1 Penicillin amidase [Opitutus terrae PB90-1]